MKTLHSEVLKFWFEDLSEKQWFEKSETLDQKIRGQFSELHSAAAACELSDWRRSIEGRLAEVILLDQFSRNIYRGDPKAFANDSLALAIAQEAVLVGADQQLDVRRRAFLYMPYMHSESLFIHEAAIGLFSAPGLEFNLKFELAHKKIIERFGRYPHRNAVLGRVSTPEEIQFLSEPGSSF